MTLLKIINAHVSSREAPLYSYQFLMQLEFSRQIFEKSSKYQISRKSVELGGGRVFPWTDGWIERRDVSNSRFIRNYAKDPEELSSLCISLPFRENCFPIYPCLYARDHRV